MVGRFACRLTHALGWFGALVVFALEHSWRSGIVKRCPAGGEIAINTISARLGARFHLHPLQVPSINASETVTPPVVLWCALGASVLYTFGVLLLKRSTQWNPGVWRTTILCNGLTALAFLPLWLLGGQVPDWALVWQPLVVGGLFVAGQVLAILALTRGDVSVATPMLGIKILLVAVFASAIAGTPLPLRIWAAAMLATVAVALMGFSGRSQHRRVRFTLICSALAAASYAMFDALIQQWSPAWGVGRFMPLTMLCSAALSLALIPLCRGPVFEIARPARLSVLLGCALIGIQALIFGSSIANWGHAAPANVVYSMRGLWSVLLIWAIGHWVSHEERALGGHVLVTRMLGATCLSLAVLLIL